MCVRYAIIAATVLATALPLSAQTINCALLREPVSSPRWLSIPQSRLVINPAGGADFLPLKAPVAEGFGPALPMNLAYWVGGEQPVKLPMFWSWQPSRKGADASKWAVGTTVDLLKSKQVTWRNQDVTRKVGKTGVSITLTGKSFGHLAGTLTVDLDKTPYVLVSIAKHGEARWALKVSDDKQAVDTYLQGDTTTSGDMLADVRAATGWHGKKKFSVKLFVVGEPGSTIDCPTLKFVGLSSDFPTLAAERTIWAPHQIVTDAQCAAMRADLQTSTFFPDESTIAQTIHVRKTSPTSLILRGVFPDGKLHWDSAHHALVLESDNLRAVIALNRPARWLGTSSSLVKAVTTPLNPRGTSGMWAIALDDVKAGDNIAVVARFAPGPGATAELVSQAAAMASVRTLNAALAKRESAWNKMLTLPPRPADFSMHAMKNRGISPEQIRRAYYRAWVFLVANILPPMPENGYPYPQVSCGKPSLWAEGHPKSRSSAQWESMIAMLFTTCVDPEATWQAFEGLMSCVDADGAMGGEGLPARHCQVAWKLYNETGDRERLRKLYPAMKRLLQWKISDPRWVFKGLTPPGMKDIEFVVHDLMDIQYARQIADTLDMPEESAYWQSQREDLGAKFRQWFLSTPGTVYRIYDERTDGRASADYTWSIPAIVLAPDILQESGKAAMIKLLKSNLDLEKPFMIQDLVKHPSLSYTMQGAWQYGLVQETTQLAEAIMRDVAAAGEFAEGYFQWSYPPKTVGVTPSVFGAANVIDASLWHNGILYTDRIPTIVRLPNASGVSNLSVRGSRIDVSFDKTSDGVTLSGKGLSNLAMPEGFTAVKTDDGATQWQGTLATGGTLRLSLPQGR